MSGCFLLALVPLVLALAAFHRSARLARHLSPAALRSVWLIAGITLLLTAGAVVVVVFVVLSFQTPHFDGALENPPAGLVVLVPPGGAPGRPFGGAPVLARTDSPAACIEGEGSAEVLRAFPSGPVVADGGATITCGSYRPVSASEIRVLLDGRGFVGGAGVLESRSRPCVVDPRCFPIHNGTDDAPGVTHGFVLYNESSVQTVAVRHGNHSGSEVTFTYAADAHDPRRFHSIGLLARSFVYECSPH